VGSTNLYWGTTDSTSTTGTVMTMPLTGGGSPAAIVSAPGTIVALAVDATSVYWASSSETLLEAPLTGLDAGSSPTQIAADLALGIALDATSVYWASYTDDSVKKVAKAPADSGAAVVLVPGGGGMGANQIALDTTSIYWTNRVSGTVSSAPIGGGAATTLSTGPSGASGIAVNAADAYWGNGTSIESVAIAGGTATVLASPPSGGDGLQIDATSIYWTNGVNSVFKMPIGGGTPVVLASGQAGPSGIVIDATSVYWANHGDGSIKTVLK
jgi:hypothetical protein